MQLTATKLICAAMLLFILAIPTRCSITSIWNRVEIQKNMSDYLKNTYGKEFVVTRPSQYYGGGLFPWTPIHNFVTEAYPKDEPDLRFSIIVLNWHKPELRELRDDYLYKRWSRQGTKLMEKKLRDVYGDDFWLKKYCIGCKYMMGENHSKKLKELDYSGFINQSAGKMPVDIKYFVFIDDKLDKKYEAERAFKILKENLIDLKTPQYGFSAVYVLKEKKSALDEVYRKTKEGDYERGTKALLDAGIAQDSTGTSYVRGISEKYNEKIVKNADDLMRKFKN